MIRRPPRSTRTDTLFPYPTLFRSQARLQLALKSYDLSGHDLDAPFPDVPPESVVSRGRNHVEAARREGLTLRQVLIRSSGSNAHFAAIGTVKDVTDEIQHWFEDGACDGFKIGSASCRERGCRYV